MIKLVATDLDDTLLNAQWEVSPANAEAIRRAVSQNVKVTLATGRMALSTRKYARQLELDIPIITYHGALVEQGLSGEILYRKVIPVDLAADIVENLRQRKIHHQVFIKDRIFVQQWNAHAEAYSKMASVPVEETDIFTLLSKEQDGTEKILCIGDQAELQTTMAELRLLYGDKLHFTSSRADFFDMVHPEVNKGNALKALAEQWGINRDEVMAVGDSLNDLEMLQYAGVGVAVANAHPAVKKAADYITDSNREDGVAKAIQRFVLDPEI